jgi:RHS repeat-associated protein
LDSQGNVVNRISYDAFGGVTAETNPSVDFRFLYTGQEYDPETGNYFYNTRFYNPLNGVFIQEDKIGFAGGDTNLYRYVFNSPTNYTDPTGEFVPALLIPVGVAIFGIGVLYELNSQVNQLQDKIDSLPPDVFDPNNLNKPTNPDLSNPDLSDDFPGTQFIPPAEEPSTLPFPGYQDERKLEDSHTGDSCGINPPDDLFSDHFEARKRKPDDFDASEEYKTPKPNISGKEGAKNVPSWARGYRPKVGESGAKFADRILKDRYGKDFKYKTGPNTEFNQIKKWGDRNFE